MNTFSAGAYFTLWMAFLASFCCSCWFWLQLVSPLFLSNLFIWRTGGLFLLLLCFCLTLSVCIFCISFRYNIIYLYFFFNFNKIPSFILRYLLLILLFSFSLTHPFFNLFYFVVAFLFYVTHTDCVVAVIIIIIIRILLLLLLDIFASSILLERFLNLMKERTHDCNFLTILT